MKNNYFNKILIALLSLGFVFLSIENLLLKGNSSYFTGMLYYLFYIVVIYYFIDISITQINSNFSLKKSYLDITILVVLFFIITYKNQFKIGVDTSLIKTAAIAFIMVRNTCMIFKKGISSDNKKFSQALMNNPAKTVLLSYFIFTFIGAILLILPISSSTGEKLGFINALFTSTSALCVTGLTVVDTASRFSLFGQLVILTLIQLGGLGIMIFSYLITTFIAKKVSIEAKITVSYLLSDNDMAGLLHNIRNIFIITFIIEGVGAISLFISFYKIFGFSITNVYYSVFHSISAFCNAGFSLFSDNLIGFQNSPLTVFTLAGLIIFGGLSFVVITNLFDTFKNKLKKHSSKRSIPVLLNANTKIVCITTGILILSGTLIIYFLEHMNTFIHMNIFSQYMNAFFQAVTLRTAGFNSIDIGALTSSTLLIMVFFMFIGGASGSTAGGIKVNTFTVILITIRSFIKDRSNVTIFNKSIRSDLIIKSFIILILSISIVFLNVTIISIVENQPTIQIIFEVVSAFGTVGLSTGITSDLRGISKLVLVITMFIGKIGPLTLFGAITQREKTVTIEYPDAEIMIG